MKPLILILFCFAFTLTGLSQLSVSRSDGGSVITNLDGGLKVNEGSSLKREFITINDPGCPMQLFETGVTTIYNFSNYSFKPAGTFNTTEAITAYEVRHILYNVFGAHISSLSNQQITDIHGKKVFSRFASWDASENDLSEYFICVSFVAQIRTKAGVIWRYNYKDIKVQFDKLKIAFEEGYVPKKNIEKNK